MKRHFGNIKLRYTDYDSPDIPYTGEHGRISYTNGIGLKPLFSIWKMRNEYHWRKHLNLEFNLGNGKINKFKRR